MDYSYHVNYTAERQQWQDSLIQSVAKRTEKQEHPWGKVGRLPAVLRRFPPPSF